MKANRRKTEGRKTRPCEVDDAGSRFCARTNAHALNLAS